MRHASRITLLLASAALLAGCGTVGGIFKKKPGTPIAGERVAVLVNEAEIKVDEATAAAPMSLPAATGDHRPAGEARGAAAAFADRCGPGDAQHIAERDMADRLARVAARLRPAVVGSGRG